MFCLKAPACIHFSLCIRLSWNGNFFFLRFFFTILSNISNLFKNMKNQNAKYRNLQVFTHMASQLACLQLCLGLLCLGLLCLGLYLPRRETNIIYINFITFTYVIEVSTWFKMGIFHTNKIFKKGEKDSIPHPCLKPWRALRQKISFF